MEIKRSSLFKLVEDILDPRKEKFIESMGFAGSFRQVFIASVDMKTFGIQWIGGEFPPEYARVDKKGLRWFVDHWTRMGFEGLAKTKALLA